MLWAAMVLAGVVLGLMLAGVPIALWHRWRAARRPGSFRCKVREVGPLLDTPDRPPRVRWWDRPGVPALVRRCAGRARRRPFPMVCSTAWWVSDVLAVQGGLGVTGIRLYPVVAADSVRRARGRRVHALGPSPSGVLLILADGRVVEVAVTQDDADLLAGPLAPRVPAHRN